ncbi:MAG: hypothetical protein NTW62_01555 [Candidatus Nomurabacteria bacterium]|nr:hypothetical protein [Candidatus Nomurabacteria bacterium]
MKPQHVIIMILSLIGIQQSLQHFALLQSVEVSFTLQYLCLVISSCMLIFTFKDFSIRIKSDLLMVSFFIMGFWMIGFSTCFSVVAILNFFQLEGIKYIDPMWPIYGTIAGQAMFLIGFSFNGVGKDFA